MTMKTISLKRNALAHAIRRVLFGADGYYDIQASPICSHPIHARRLLEG